MCVKGISHTRTFIRMIAIKIYFANTFGDMSNHDKLIIPTVQRALVLQGGGAPGAYQAGAFKALYEKLRKIIGSGDNDNNEPLFDIIAGTSIGAINGAISFAIFLKIELGRVQQKDLKVFGSIYPPLLLKFQKH